MNPVLTEILPIFILIGIGILLRQFRVLNQSHGHSLLRLLFYIALPGLVLHSFTTTSLNPTFFFLPVLAVLIHLSALLLAWIAGRFYKLSRENFGVFLIGSMIMNTGFVLPFAMAGYGNEGVARVVMVDFGNVTVTFTFAYYLASRYGAKSTHGLMLNKLFRSPPVWAILSGILLNLTDAYIPDFLALVFRQTGNLAVPILLISLGLFFNAQFKKLRYAFSIILIRAISGLSIAFAGILLFDITGITRDVLLMVSLSPVGLNTITIASLEELNSEFAAALVSTTILAGLIIMPLMLFLLQP